MQEQKGRHRLVTQTQTQRHRNRTGDSGHKWRERKIPTGYKEAAFHSEQG